MSAVLSRLSFFPTDARQSLRIGRFLMAAGTSLLVCATLLACARFDLLPWKAAVEGTSGIVALIVVFYLLFRSGLNLRFADPSLTTEQAGAAIIFLTYIMYHAGPARDALVPVYLMTMLFGALSLSVARLMVLAALALAAYATMAALLLREPQADARGMLTQLGVLAVVLPWFAAMSGYVNRLRTRLADSHRELKGAFERIEELAVRDELTGVYNRRFLMEALGTERKRAERSGTSYCVCLIDIDHFKAINDSLGHAAGDAVLRALPRLASAGLRGVDVFGRHGGEEFLLLLPGTTLQGARVAAERVRAAIAAARFPDFPADRRVTLTLGLVEAGKGEQTEALLARADRALYAGKRAGRNQVVIG